MVPDHSPVIILGRYVIFCSSLPWCMIASIAPCVSNGHMENAMFAEVRISCRATPTIHGNPPPPYPMSKGTAPQPASTYA